jgi:hypothetical protein
VDVEHRVIRPRAPPGWRYVFTAVRRGGYVNLFERAIALNHTIGFDVLKRKLPVGLD